MSHNQMNNTQKDFVPFRQHRKIIIIFLLGAISGISWGYTVSSYFNLRDYLGGTPLSVNVINQCVDSVKAESPADEDVKEAEKSGEGMETSSLPPSIEKILDKVFILESSAGKHDSCHNQGKFNGYGLASNRICFDTQEEARKVVAEWFQDKFAKGFTEGESLCFYQSGKRINNCEYYNNFKTI